MPQEINFFSFANLSNSKWGDFYIALAGIYRLTLKNLKLLFSFKDLKTLKFPFWKKALFPNAASTSAETS